MKRPSTSLKEHQMQKITSFFYCTLLIINGFFATSQALAFSVVGDQTDMAISHAIQGDFDGDGITDFAVCNPNYVAASPSGCVAYDPNNPNNPYTTEDPECDGMTNAGAIHIFTTTANFGQYNLAAANILITGESQDQQLGLYCFSDTARDMDSDGIDDMIVADANDWMILYGSNGLTGTNPLSNMATAYIAQSTDIEQPVVADMNGDTIADLAYFEAYRYTTMYLYGAYGNFVQGGTNYGLNGFGHRNRAISATTNRGTVFTSAGDVNGDGYEDLLTGDSWNINNTTPSNSAYLYLSTPNRTLSNGNVIANTCFYNTNYQCPAFTQISYTTSNGAADLVGTSVAGVGDVNGDGYDDFAIGAPGKTLGNNQQTGAVYLVLGSANPTSLTLSNTTAGVVEYVGSATYGDCVGASVGKAGDLNNDGYDDFVIGSNCSDTGNMTNRGAVYVVRGSAQIPTTGFRNNLIVTTSPMLTTNRGVMLYLGKAAGDELGSAVGPAGDPDSDGLPSFYMNAPYNDDSTNNGGKFWVFEYSNSISPVVVP